MRIPQQDLLQTPFGVFAGISGGEADAQRRVTYLQLNERNAVVTHIGELIPYYKTVTPRRKEKPSISFYKNGMIKTVYLEEQQEVQTPIGELPAECVTFYDSGELKRLFPQYGQISGLWSEEDERALCIPFHFDLGFTEFTARLNCVHFYKSGAIRSITLFPGETISVKTPCDGEVKVRTGFSMTEEGSLDSWEPALPTPVQTPLGKVTAFDTTALGIHADCGSVQLDSTGSVQAVATCSERLISIDATGHTQMFGPTTVPSALEEGASVLIPLRLSWAAVPGSLTVETSEGKQALPLEKSRIQLIPAEFGSCSPERCAGCSGCSG